MVHRSAPQRGERVLVTGASGGVGSAAVQLCKVRGAEVAAVTTSSKAESLRAIGADQIIDRNDEQSWKALGKNSVDVVLDLVGGASFPRLLDMLRPFGRYAVSGAIEGPLVQLDLRTLYLKDQRFYGCTVLDEGVFADLTHLINQGKIKPLVAATYPLSEIRTAQEDFQKKAHIGKIVLTMPKSQ
mmetsp:Transcript_47878/g.110957  ORF Transcript_47878/g.110957 Transcript_47878/m.110957 type:complete len:185 (+) Transcript_47878:748-1302(+)